MICRPIFRLAGPSLALCLFLAPIGCADSTPPADGVGEADTLSRSPATASETPAEKPPSPAPLTLASPRAVYPLAGGQEIHIPLNLAPGDVARGEAVQNGLDVELEVLNAAGESLLWVDTPVGASGRELFVVVSPAGGPHRLRLKAFGKENRRGRVEVRLTSLGPATAQDRIAFTAARATAEAEGLRVRLGRERDLVPEALAAFGRAADHWRRAGQPSFEARMWMEIGGIHWRYGRDLEASEPYLRRAAEDLAPEDRSYIARLHHYWGEVAYADERPSAAREHYRVAVDHWPAAQSTSLAGSLNNLGYTERLMGFPQRALERYGQALELWRQSGRQFQEARTLHNLGKIHAWLGDHVEARRGMNLALEIWRRLDNPEEAAVTLASLGQIDAIEGNFDSARELLDRALADHRKAKNARGEAHLMGDLGELERRAGDADRAVELLQKALPLLAESGADRERGRAHVNLAELYLSRGDLERAESQLKRAESLFDALGIPLFQASCRQVAARLALARGRLDAAAAAAAEAVVKVETLRSRPADWLHRAGFLSMIFGVFETAVDVEVARARARPGQGFELRALAWAERSRARAFLDRLAVREDGKTMARGRPLDRQELLATSSDRTLIFYFLGRQASYLWRLSAAGMELYTLPPRREIDRQARAFYELLSQRPRVELRTRQRMTRERLSRLLLPEGVLDEIQDERLWILPDGPLSYLPFAALSYGNDLLVDRFETVYAPSLSSLAGFDRNRREPRPSADLRLGDLVVADPVYGRDPRCAEAPPLPSSAFRRLPGTAREVAEIVPFLGAEPRVLRGFEAHRDALLAEPLSEYRRLHFAVHGELEAGATSIPRLVLAQRDSRCRPRPSFIDVDDIAGWTLHSELVVLSACGTGLGRDLLGEGLVGMTHAFLQAGSARVAVSLWEVDDQGSARLMEAFYRRLQDLPPAAALRAAQLELRSRPGFQAPFHWAPFVLHGV